MEHNPKLRYQSAPFTLVLHLFRRYLVDNDLDTSDAEQATIHEFYDWTQEQDELFPDQSLLSEAYDLAEDDEDAFEFVEQIFDSPFTACGHLTSWWPALVYSGRPPLKHPPVSIFLNVGVVFEDGQIATIPMPLGPQETPYTAGLILTFWRRQLEVVEELVRSQGIDFLHDSSCTDDDPTTTRNIEITKNPEGPQAQ